MTSATIAVAMRSTLRALPALLLLSACDDGSTPGTGGAAPGSTSSATSASTGDVSTASGATTTTASVASSTSTGATVCTPGETMPCYSGPAMTDGIGICHGGSATCLADGSGFGACAGEQLPAATDDCATLEDDDCTGLANEGCLCTPGTTVPCYDGGAEEGVGVCHAGTATCDASGTSIGACSGQVLPGTQTCDLPLLDGDCDGAPNESCCTSGAWTFEDILSVPTPAFDSDIAIDAAGGVHIVFYDHALGVVRYAYRPRGGVFGGFENFPTFGYYPRIAVDATNTIHVLYMYLNVVHHATKPIGGTFTDGLVDSAQGESVFEVTPGGDVHVVSRYNDTTSYGAKPAGAAMFSYEPVPASAVDVLVMAGDLDDAGVFHYATARKPFSQATWYGLTHFERVAGTWTPQSIESLTNGTAWVYFEHDGRGHAVYGTDSNNPYLRYETRAPGSTTWAQENCFHASLCYGITGTMRMVAKGGVVDAIYGGASGLTQAHRNGAADWTVTSVAPASLSHQLTSDAAGGLHLLYLDMSNASPMLRYGYRCP